MEIFNYEFMRNAFLTGIIAGVVCPAVGLFITLRRLSMIADALSHVCLSGVVAGLIMGTHPVATAAVFSLSGAFIIEALRSRYRTYSELAIAIILSAGVAGGAILLSLGSGLNANFMSYLFGSIITVSAADMTMVFVAGTAIMAGIKLFYRELFLLTFDEEGARVSGLPVTAISIGFTAATALTIAISIKVVGILLVSSLMILPVAAALRLSGSFKKAFFLSVILGEASVVAGLFASFYLNLIPGGAIIAVSVVILIAAIAFFPGGSAGKIRNPVSS